MFKGRGDKKSSVSFDRRCMVNLVNVLSINRVMEKTRTYTIGIPPTAANLLLVIVVFVGQ